MYIQEVCIDGFKSYAQRVVLENFDKTFNAITGMNGSGKSNVLDSICFVLGIKNLGQVRAANLQDLVYKQGQAGITKASVSITFKNDDPRTSPAGYEDKETITVTRTIVVGGRDKYTINGHIAQAGRVADFFHSVQLNVNNPHFLIMQGVITKVLNMKPPEILSLLEEASGTRMYEKKKEVALRTLEKKEAKIAEIDNVLQLDILPSVETLKRQCAQYEEWARLETRSKQVQTLLTAWEYTECNRLAGVAQADLDAAQNTLNIVAQKQQDITGQIGDVESLIRDLQTEKEIQMGGEVRELQANVDKLSMELTKTTALWKSKCESLASEKSNLASIQASAEQLASQDLPAQLAQAQEKAAEAQTALRTAQESVEAAQCELTGAEAGDGRDHTNRTLSERLADTQRLMDAADSEAKAATVKARLLTDQLASSKKALAACGKEASQAQAERAAQQRKIEDCRSRLESLGYDKERVTQLESDIATASGEVRTCRDNVDRLSQDVEGCMFKYTSPGGSFDPKRVRGVLAKQLRVQQPHQSLALEVTAGGKLYQIVVDDDTTAKQLLDKGKLTRRVTIIPLNKIQYPELSRGVLEAADKLGGGKAKPALQLVGYDKHVEPAVKYAFGNTFVCEDSGTAKKLAFSREVNCRCVTLEGDDFNPSGLLTGGTRQASRSLLASLSALLEAEQKLEAAQARLAGLQAELAKHSGKAKQYNKLEQDLALAQHSLTLLEERLAGTQASQLAETCEQLAKDLEAAQSAAKTATENKAQLQDQCKALEREVATFASSQKSRIKAAQDKLKAAKASVEKRKGEAKAAEAAAVRAAAELEGAASEQEALAGKIKEATALCEGLTAEAGKLESKMSAAKEAYQAAEAQLKARRSRLKECDSDISGHEKALAKLRRQLQDLENDVRKADNKAKQRHADLRKLQDTAAELEREYPDVIRDKAQFGTGDYDFKKYNMKDLRAELEQAYERCHELRSKVDAKVIDKLQKAEGEFKALTAKRETVDKDRDRIQQVISELDEKKRVAMCETWKHVDREFGAIFTTLLPGTEARLEPPEGQTFEDGLEVRVAFGGVWKTSLTELSGGQRSLLALSLILALCKFKPAPLYILDEVDSALDLNHTQNIGAMIRNHFPNSQFLIVSLKDGMFSHANVIFRTKFVDGVSAITRTTPTAAERAIRASGAAAAEGAGGARKGAEQPRSQVNRRPLAALNA